MIVYPYEDPWTLATAGTLALSIGITLVYFFKKS